MTTTTPVPNEAQPQPLESPADPPPASQSQSQPQKQSQKSKFIPQDIDSLAESFQKASLSAERPKTAAPSKPKGKQKDKHRGQQKHKMTGRSKEEKVKPSKESGGVPMPSMKYLEVASYPTRPLKMPQNLLVVIDLNGTILYRPNKAFPTKFIARPHAQRFLDYCINTFYVVIWSSARPENVRALVDSILTPELKQKVVAVWARDTFGLTPKDYNLRVQCYKRLEKIWADPHISISHPALAQGITWGQTNTVLVDDSQEKGRSEPFNLIRIPEFFGDLNEPGDILPQVHDYLNFLSLHSNVSACLKYRPFIAQMPGEVQVANNAVHP